MATTTETNPKQSLGEPDAHVASRQMLVGVRILLVLSLVATVALLVFNRPAAYLAAIPVPVLSIIWGILHLMEQRSRASVLRKSGQTELSQEEVEVDVETIGFITILKVLGILAIGTFIIAAVLFDLAIVGAVAAAGFSLAILIEVFYFPLFLSEPERDEREKLTGKRK